MISNSVPNNKGNIGSIGASGNSKTEQNIEKNGFSLTELIKWLALFLFVIAFIVLLILFISGKASSEDIKILLSPFLPR